MQYAKRPANQCLKVQSTPGFLPNWDKLEPKPVFPYGMTPENWIEPQKTGPKWFELVCTEVQLQPVQTGSN